MHLRGPKESELDAELRFDYDQRIAAHLRSGLNESEARRAVRLEFGGLEQVKEDCRDARALEFLHSFFRDARYAARNMRRSPGFFVLAIAILALGIGINATVFTVTNTVLFKGFPLVAHNDRILYISTQNGVSYPDFEDWRAAAKSFVDLALVAELPVSLTDNTGYPESYIATRVTSNAFQVIGQKPFLGRDFSFRDDQPGAAPVAILTYAFWERRFGKNPSIIGRALRLNGSLVTVVGVMPRGFTFPERQELWLPLVPTPALEKRENRSLWFAFGRMAPGVAIQNVRAEMAAIGKRLEIANPQTNQGVIPDPRTFAESFIGPTAPRIYSAMWGAVGFVLLIACANLANLLLARATGRTREISVRIALGAGRWRILRQLLIESVILSSLGGFFGWWLAQLGVRAYELIVTPPTWFDHVLTYQMDYRVLAYLIVISIATGLLFGLAPAARLSKLDVNRALKESGRGSAGAGRIKHLSNLLVITEMALALVLLAAAGVMIRSFLNLYNQNLGVNADRVVTGYLLLPTAKYPDLPAHVIFYDRLTARLEAIPGVDSVAIADSTPTYSTRRLPFELADAPAALPQSDAANRPKLGAVVVSPSYFRTLGAAVISGREFSAADSASSIPVVIVNQRFAAKFWPGENPIGKRLRVFVESAAGQAPQPWLTVVGVASNIIQFGRTRPDLDTLIYLAHRQQQISLINFFVRTRLPSGSIGATIRRQLQSLDPDLPVSYYMPLAERMAWGFNLNRSMAVLFLVFAAIALLLASIGLYAVISHAVSRRTQEIGIRAAMGASARDILRLILSQGMLPVAIGLAVGLAAALAVTPILKSQLVQISPSDPATLAAAAAVLILSAILGCIVPARRAAAVDPAIALRHE